MASGERAEGWGPWRRAASMWSFDQFGLQSVGHLVAYASKRAAAGWCFAYEVGFKRFGLLPMADFRMSSLGIVSSL